eukprot:403342928
MEKRLKKQFIDKNSEDSDEIAKELGKLKKSMNKHKERQQQKQMPSQQFINKVHPQINNQQIKLIKQTNQPEIVDQQDVIYKLSFNQQPSNQAINPSNEDSTNKFESKTAIIVSDDQGEDSEDDLSSDHFLTVSEGSSSSFQEDSEPDSEETWIEWFCSRKGNEFICKVDQQFIMDKFNLHDLKNQVQHYDDDLLMILDMENNEDSFDELKKKDQDLKFKVKEEAPKLYTLIHQRYIETPIGLDIMKSKMLKGDFGYCPRVLCEKQPVIPWGESNQVDKSQTRSFCPRCKGLFQPDYLKHQKLDGAFFGPNFAGILSITYPKIIINNKQPKKFKPQIFGFKIHETSPIKPRLLPVNRLRGKSNI